MEKQTKPFDVIAGNVYRKYETKNPVAKLLMSGFFNALDGLIIPLEVEKVLEIGCGEGFLTKHIKDLKKNIYIEGIDSSERIIEIASGLHPEVKFSVASAYQLPYQEKSFDLIVACEVLEHLEEPSRALKEIEKVTKTHCIFSIPREPLWRILNIMRGRYIKNFGDTPGHIQHWKEKEFVSLLKGHFIIKAIRRPFPWIMVLCQV